MMKLMKWKAAYVLSFCLIMLLGGVSDGLAVKQYTITCLASWSKAAMHVDFFLKDFIERVQKEADKKYPGELKLVFKGGPEVVATFEQIDAVKKGMIDLLYGSMTYYVSKMPESDVLNLSTLTPSEERAVGLYDYLDKLHNKKTNTHFLVRNGLGRHYNLGLTAPIKTLADLKGKSIRVNQTTLQLAKKLGANPVQMSAGEAFTALERGVIQGHFVPGFLVRTFGLEKVTKYLVFPGVYDVIVNIVINLDTWNKLPKHLQKFLTEQADIHATNAFEYYAEQEKKELARYKADGMVMLNLPKPEADKFVKIAREAMLEVVMKKAPVEGKKLLEFLNKKP